MNKFFFASLPIMVLLLGASKEGKFKQPDPNYIIIVSAKSQTIAPGTKYEGEILLYSKPAEMPSMFFEGRQISVDENGIGKINFTSVAGIFDKEGMAKKKYNGKVVVKINGKDSILSFTGEYIVKKSDVVVDGLANGVLYRNFGNEINVQVPSLGAIYNPSFRATGANLIMGAKKGYVTIVPSADEVILEISSSGNLIGRKEFKVRPAPLPQIKIYQDSIPVDLRNGLRISDLKNLQLRIFADNFFQTNLPKDVRYKITEVSTSLMRINQIVDTISFNESTMDLSSYKSKAQKGDRIVVEVKKLTRGNFMNKTEAIVPDELVTIPLY